MRIVDQNAITACRTNAGGRCEHCFAPCGSGEVHHLWGRGFGGGNRLDVPCNLIFLCKVCHRSAHDGNIAHKTLLSIVAYREGTTPDGIQETIWELRRKPKESQ